MKRIHIIVSLVLLVVITISVYLFVSSKGVPIVVRYGITPYQDSALPVVAHELGWYKENGLNVKLVPVTWGDVVSALVSNSIDVAVYNFNSFQPPYENAVKSNKNVIFYCPLYLFKGQAIMVHGGRGIESFREIAGEANIEREKRIRLAASQLKGKRIAVTRGTELEQIVIAALNKANLSEKDVTIIHASPEDSLAAFLSGSIDVFAAGLTERVEARRHGAIELLVTADLMLPVVDGIVTTEVFAKKHPELMDKLVSIWFKTIGFMERDLKNNSTYIRQYLAQSASTRYSAEEYEIAWTFNVFPRNPAEANSLFNNRSSPSFWQAAWDENNKFLIAQKKISNPVPREAYWGEEVLKRLLSEK